MDKYETARTNMVTNQILPNKVTNRELLQAFGSIPRHNFLPEQLRGIAYTDETITIGGGRYLMPAMFLARLIQTANIGPEDVVLDIACGYGYSSAILSCLAKKVVAVESNPDLLAKANLALSRLGTDNVVTVDAQLTEGHPEGAPYNVILINGSIPLVPQGITHQLADGGRLLAIVSDSPYTGSAVSIERIGNNFVTHNLFDAKLPLLTDFTPDETPHKKRA